MYVTCLLWVEGGRQYIFPTANYAEFENPVTQGSLKTTYLSKGKSLSFHLLILFLFKIYFKCLLKI